MVERSGIPSRSFELGERVCSTVNGQRGYVTGFRLSPDLGFRFRVIWDDGCGYSLVVPEELVPAVRTAA